MGRKYKLKGEIKEVEKIYFFCKKSFYYASQHHYAKTPEEDSDFIQQVMWRTTIIELTKLFSSSIKRDKFNLFRFVEKVKAYYNHTLHIEESSFLEWESQLNDCKPIIDKLLILRDKVYAHTDRNSRHIDTDIVSFEEAEKLLVVAEVILEEVHFRVFESPIIEER